VLYDIVNRPFPAAVLDAAGLPDRLIALIMQMTAKDPRERPRDLETVLEMLETIQGSAARQTTTASAATALDTAGSTIGGARALWSDVVKRVRGLLPGGIHRLGTAMPLMLAALVAVIGIAAVFATRGSPRAPAFDSVAVLPFSGAFDDENAYLAEGLAEG
jgi:hypothetical protein